MSKKLLIVAIIIIAVAGAFHPTRAQQSQRTTWDGVYSEEQARRGEAAYGASCSNCHGRDLAGADMTPGLTGYAFMANWDSLSLSDLVERIRISMPQDRPGTLSRQQTVDIVSFVLRFNEFPAGKEELARETQVLKEILFKAQRP